MPTQRWTGLALVLACMASTACTKTTERAVNPEEARLVSLAADIQRRGDKRSALPLFERAVTVAGDKAAANTRLGTARLEAGDPDGAQAAFREALALEPQNAGALLGLGTAQLRAGQVDAAARSLSAAVPLVRTPTAYNRYGTALMLQGDGTGAEAAFAQAAKLDPANLDTQSNLALALALSGKPAEGAEVAGRVAASPRAEPRHFRNQMLVLLLAGREREAQTVPVPDYPEAERRRFLADARKVGRIRDTAGRARAIGLLASG